MVNKLIHCCKNKELVCFDCFEAAFCLKNLSYKEINYYFRKNLNNEKITNSLYGVSWANTMH